MKSADRNKVHTLIIAKSKDVKLSWVQFSVLSKVFKIPVISFEPGSDGTVLFYGNVSLSSNDIQTVFFNNVNKWIDVEMEYA